MHASLSPLLLPVDDEPPELDELLLDVVPPVLDDDEAAPLLEGRPLEDDDVAASAPTSGATSRQMPQAAMVRATTEPTATDDSNCMSERYHEPVSWKSWLASGNERPQGANTVTGASTKAPAAHIGAKGGRGCMTTTKRPLALVGWPATSRVSFVISRTDALGAS